MKDVQATMLDGELDHLAAKGLYQRNLLVTRAPWLTAHSSGKTDIPVEPVALWVNPGWACAKALLWCWLIAIAGCWSITILTGHWSSRWACHPLAPRNSKVTPPTSCPLLYDKTFQP
jgi:hypothetical protein